MSIRKPLDRVETPTAKVEHGCVICLRWIAPGERYVRFTGINRETGDFGSSAYCLGCDLAWRYHNLFLDHDWDDCCYLVECLEDADGIMAAVFHEAITERWWPRPPLAVVA